MNRTKEDKNRQHSSHETAPKPLIDLLETFPFILLEKVELWKEYNMKGNEILIAKYEESTPPENVSLVSSRYPMEFRYTHTINYTTIKSISSDYYILLLFSRFYEMINFCK